MQRTPVEHFFPAEQLHGLEVPARAQILKKMTQVGLRKLTVGSWGKALSSASARLR